MTLCFTRILIVVEAQSRLEVGFPSVHIDARSVR